MPCCSMLRRLDKLEANQKKMSAAANGGGASDSSKLADLEALIRALEGRVEQQEQQLKQQRSQDSGASSVAVSELGRQVRRH